MRNKAIISLLCVTVVLFGALGCGNRVREVGKDIKQEAITEFYYTIDSSAYPPKFMRYRLYVNGDKYMFHYEKREGNHWPLTEADITDSVTVELPETEWKEFMDSLEGGSVTARSKQENTSGGKGPWLYLYWDGDKGENQVFEFKDSDAMNVFEDLAESQVEKNR